MDSLEARIDTLRKLLPGHLQGEAERFIRVAAFYFNRSESLQKCTPQSFMACVLQGAQLGLALDGRLAHAVAYNTRKKDTNGREYWENVATFMPDFKGLVAVARRARIIRDIFANLVYSNDEFSLWEEDDQTHLVHRFDPRADRGTVIGAYAKVLLYDGGWRCEWMDYRDLERIRNKSRAKDKGPWATDKGEMQRKTVLRRALKTYIDDPILAHMLGLEDEAPDGAESHQQAKPALPTGRTSIRPPKASPAPTNGNGNGNGNGHHDSLPDSGGGERDYAPPDGEGGPDDEPPGDEMQIEPAQQQPADREKLLDQLKNAIRTAKTPDELEAIEADIAMSKDIIGPDGVDFLGEMLAHRKSKGGKGKTAQGA